jgi:hypothetical protein
MSKNKKEQISYVKHVPDFLAKMGLTYTEVKDHTERHAEAKLEDKFAKKSAGKEEEKDDYDFDNA